MASSRYGLYRGRYRDQVRLGAVVLIGFLIATSHPHPSGHGGGLVILVALVVALGSQVAAVVIRDRFPVLRSTLEMVSSGVLAGYDPGTAGCCWRSRASMPPPRFHRRLVRSLLRWGS